MNAFFAIFKKKLYFFKDTSCYIYRTPASPVYFPGVIKGSRL